MALKLRYFEADQTIRSIDSVPNGILMIGGNNEDGACFAIHPTVQPVASPFWTGSPSILITATEAVESCADKRTVAMLWKTVMLGTAIRAESALESFTPEDALAFAELAVATRDAMVETGHIHQADPDG